MDNTALPSTPDHKINEGKAVFSQPTTPTCRPLRGELTLDRVELFAGVLSRGSDHIYIFDTQALDLNMPLTQAMAAPVFPRLGYICSLSALLLMLLGVSQSGPIVSPEDQRRASAGRGVIDTPLLGQNDDLDAQDLLSQFLSTLNLTERVPQSRPPTAHKEPPEYMLELYNRFANDRTAVPSANIVRSFKNEGKRFF